VRLNSGDKKIYRTDLQGRILIKTDGKTIQVETMKGQGNSK
jgi:beta-lactamase superfamily II metal-dependent hydrolase